MPKLNAQLLSLPSEDIDRHLGFKIRDTEGDLLKEARKLRPEGDQHNLGHVLHEGQQTWVGLDPQTLNTPYRELKTMCDLLDPRPGERVVDLGAGYGRLGIVLDAFYPQVEFLGLEYVQERVEEGKRVFQELRIENALLEVADLTSPEFKLPRVEYYFIYDYGKVHHIRHTLKQLEELSATHHFKVIARGKGVQSIIEHEHPWLSGIYEVVREEFFSIYSMSLPGSLGEDAVGDPER